MTTITTPADRRAIEIDQHSYDVRLYVLDLPKPVAMIAHLPDHITVVADRRLDQTQIETAVHCAPFAPDGLVFRADQLPTDDSDF